MTTIDQRRTNGHDGKDTYYYANGERIPLEREPEVFAVRYRKGQNARTIPLSRPAARLLREESQNIGFIPNYDLQLYTTEPSVHSLSRSRTEQEQDVARKIRSLDEEPQVEYAAVAFRRHRGRSSKEAKDLMFVTREFVVQFEPGVDRERIGALNAEYGVRIIRPIEYAENGFVMEAPHAEGDLSPVVLSNLYYESGLVKFAHPNFVRYRHLRGVATQDAPSKTALRKSIDTERAERERVGRSGFLSQQWHLETAKVTDAWNTTKGTSSIKVAILDDGVDVGHDEFAGKVVAQFDFASNNADGSPNTAGDSHGTACAGVAVAKGVQAFGAAPNCSLIAVRYPDFLGVVEEADMFRWTADQGADIISCSWGPEDGTGAVDPLPDNVRAAIHYCITDGRDGRGIPIFWAAGNGNESVSNDGYASNPEVMAIAASSSRETRSWYSDFGPEIFICAPSSGDGSLGEKRIFTVDRRGNAGYNPDPDTGALHPSDTNYTDDFGGTSSSTPLVAGITGLMLSANPSLTVEEVREILRDTADEIDPSGGNYDSSGHSTRYGYGRVNAEQAVLQAQQRASGGGGTSTGTPFITAPATVQREGILPVFEINTGGRSLYAVEVATEAELFNSATHGSQRTSSNFFGSWERGLESSTPYMLPSDVWDNLKHADRLFYRLHVADDNTWSNYDVTVSDSQFASAPSMQIEGGTSGGGTGGDGIDTSVVAITALPSLPRSGSAPTFQIGKGGRSLYAVEVATKAELFNSATHGSQRTSSNFFGSWERGLESSTPYVLPTDVWDNLKHADRLFYRLHVADDNTWTNYDVTVSDSQFASAPSIQLTGTAPRVRMAKTNGRRNGARAVTFPSGASFSIAEDTRGSIYYGDPVGNGAVPLIEVRGRMEEYLSRNFQVRELAARDGAPYARISVELVEGLQRMRDRIGQPIKINSAYRYPDYNSNVDGVPNSQHIAGRAADIRVDDMRPLDLARVALEELGCDIGIGLGANSVHVDLRGYSASWRYEGAELSEAEFDRYVTSHCHRYHILPVERPESAERLALAITGPERHLRGGEAPTFRIYPGANSYVAIEVATHPDLFDRTNEAERQLDTFYGSWMDEGLREMPHPGTYQLPPEAWARLNHADRLFYRAVSSATPAPTWTNIEFSTLDSAAAEAPWIEIAGQIGDRTRTVQTATSLMVDTSRYRAADEAKWRRRTQA